MFATIVGNISGFMYGKFLIILLVAVGLYFTFRTKFIQIRLFTESIRVVSEKPAQEGGTSSFGALMVSTASRVGTGNIVGVSTAICCGGYGAVFWMWLIAFIGGASAFVESTLAQIYKKRAADGSCYGGPSYYIEAALKSRSLALAFAVSLIATYGVGFNMLASYNLQSTFAVYDFYTEGVTCWIIGAIVGAVSLYCLIGGGKRIVSVTGWMVPVMGILYVLLALIVMVKNIGLLPDVLRQIFVSAFDFEAIFGGFAGSCVMYGIKRGLFSNEAGVGSAPNAAASAEVSHPVKQGLVQMLSVFIDTLLVCSATAFMGLCSGVVPTAEMAGAPYIQAALAANFGKIGPTFVVIAMALFAFTTLLGNFYYVENCVAYIAKKTPSKTTMNVVRTFGGLVIFAGAGLSVGLAWDIADVLMGVMAIINLPVLCILGSTAMKALQDYSEQKKEGKDPVFKAKNIGLKDKTDFWQ